MYKCLGTAAAFGATAGTTPASSAMEQELHRPMELPPGFRFHPTDEEIITHYLTHKALNNRFTSGVIGEVDLNKCEPWHLPG